MAAIAKPVYLRSHRLQGRVLQFILGAEDDDLRERARLSKSGRAAKTLVKEGSLRITLVAMTAGSALQSHQVAGPVSIQSMRGCLRLQTDAGDIKVPSGHLVALDAGVTHTTTAVEDSLVLLTLAK